MSESDLDVNCCFTHSSLGLIQYERIHLSSPHILLFSMASGTNSNDEGDTFTGESDKNTVAPDLIWYCVRLLLNVEFNPCDGPVY